MSVSQYWVVGFTLADIPRPALRFHIIEDDADFEVEGIRVRALPGMHIHN